MYKMDESTVIALAKLVDENRRAIRKLKFKTNFRFLVCATLIAYLYYKDEVKDLNKVKEN